MLCGDACVSAVVGALLGAAVSVITTNALIEISLNSGFALLFGACLFLVGAVIFWRVCVVADSRIANSSKALPCFALLVMLSGVFCVAVDKNLVSALTYQQKIPMYAVLGVSLSFSLTFSVVELMNFYGEALADFSLPVVTSRKQVGAMLAGAVAMGFMLGTAFGFSDAEDEPRDSSHPRFRAVERGMCVVGTAVGAVMGVVNHRLRMPERGVFDRLDEDARELFGDY